MAAMGPVPGEPEDPVLLALGFVLSHPEVDTAIVGTHDRDHLLSNVKLVRERLPIATEAVEELRGRFDKLGDDWP